MDIAVIVAIIGAMGSLAGSVIGYMTASKVSEYRLQQLEDKVDKLSSKMDAIHALSTKNEIQDEQIRQNTETLRLLSKTVDELRKEVHSK